MASEAQTQLDWIYALERDAGSRVWMTQPMGEDALVELTIEEALDQARRMAAHLRALELAPASKIAIFSKNTAWWLLADLAIWMSGHVSVPIYPTLAPDSIRGILEHADVELIFVGKLDNFSAMEPGIPAGMRRIYLPLAPARDGDSWDALIAAHEPIADSPRPDPDALATIIYTSGSTGAPKGAMHSFRTMCAAQVFIDMLGAAADDRVISYLPLAHVAERALVETVTFKLGHHLFFAESLDTFLVDICRARPTIFGSVPRLWMKFQTGVHAKLPPRRLELIMRVPLLGRWMAAKIAAGLGLDAVRFAVSGSAPTPPALVAWYDRLGVEIHEVYGMTENFAVSHCERPGGRRTGYVGGVVDGVEHRLSDAGEVQIKSPGMMLGYYQDEALTREVLEPDGWLHTGDRGEIDGHGRLRITGRIKEIFKTSKGKYVVPAPIENKLLAHPSVEQACVCGANMPQPLALVVLTPEAKAEPRADNDEALGELRRELNATLDPHEKLAKLVVSADEWTIENGLLTPTLKLKRGAIEARYGGELDSWYAREPAILWL